MRLVPVEDPIAKKFAKGILFTFLFIALAYGEVTFSQSFEGNLPHAITMISGLIVGSVIILSIKPKHYTTYKRVNTAQCAAATLMLVLVLLLWKSVNDVRELLIPMLVPSSIRAILLGAVQEKKKRTFLLQGQKRGFANRVEDGI